MADFLKVSTLIIFLLNPFFMSLYLIDLFNELDSKTFRSVIARSTVISLIVFLIFAWAGDRVFVDILHARFSSFLIFGGITFLIIGIRYVFDGTGAIRLWRGSPTYIAGSVAMPFMIGPGTIMAAIFAGSTLDIFSASLAITLSVSISTSCLLVLKWIYDHVKAKNEQLVQGYVAIMGRVMALVIGTFAVEMIFRGVEIWLETLKSTQ